MAWVTLGVEVDGLVAACSSGCSSRIASLGIVAGVGDCFGVGGESWFAGERRVVVVLRLVATVAKFKPSRLPIHQIFAHEGCLTNTNQCTNARSRLEPKEGRKEGKKKRRREERKGNGSRYIRPYVQFPGSSESGPSVIWI